jgi:nitrite reductase (NADH) large subunit
MRIVIVGNSAAALSALASFRRHDRTAAVTIVTNETARPYSRVLLPYFLRRKISYASLFIREPSFYRRMGAEVMGGVWVEAIDAPAGHLDLSGGRRLAFDQLLLATGSRPIAPPISGLAGSTVRHLWNLDDAQQLDLLLREGARVLVLGSGFVALQAAWVAVQRGAQVTVVELEERIMPTVLDEPAARMLHEQVINHGAAVHTGAWTDGLERGSLGMQVTIRGLDPFPVDAVIVATGVRPNDELLPEALEPGGRGIPVSATMETSVPGVFAAGDVSCGPTACRGPREIHALWPTAVEQGRVAGANLAGAGTTYSGSLSMNVTEMFGWTVGSLGRFVETDGDDVLVRRDLPGIAYAKVVSCDGVPAGAIAMGSSEASMLLGRLRPFVRYGRALGDLIGIVEGRVLAEEVALMRGLGPAVRRRRHVARAFPRNSSPCLTVNDDGALGART